MPTYGDPPPPDFLLPHYGDPGGYLRHNVAMVNSTSDYENVLKEVKDMLESFWQNDDPLVRFDTILAAQRRIDSIL